MKTQIRALMLTVTFVLLSVNVHAAWGDYDTTFGFLGAAIDGAVTNHSPLGVAVQADGKILVTGYRLVSGKKRFFLRRYLSNGQLDTSFGNNGSAVSNAFIIVDADYSGSRILIQANGRIAVAGIGNNNPTIWRFLSSGMADTSMGNGGMKTLSAYAGFVPRIATYSNILYVGVVVEDASQGVRLIKLNSSGTLDTSFGSGGVAVPDTDYRGYSIQTEPGTGNILVGGRQTYPETGYGLVRFLPSGVLDTSFSNFGATYGGDSAGMPDQFIRLANAQFVMNERWHNLGQGAILFGANIVRLSSSGSFTSRSVYQPTEFYNFGEPSNGTCPDMSAQQSDARVILAPSNLKKLYRFSTGFSIVTTMSCGSYATLDYRTPGVLQSDDKMIAAGTYNGNIMLVRTLP